MHTQSVRYVIDENTDGVAAARGDDHAIRSVLIENTTNHLFSEGDVQPHEETASQRDF